jgi:hypothetical protein
MLTAATAGAGGKIEFLEATANGTAKIILQAPAAITTDRTITVPDDDVNLGAIANNTGKVSATAANINTALEAADVKTGIGVDQADYPNEHNNLVVGAETGNNGMSIRSVNTGVSSIQFRGDTATNNNEGWIDYNNNSQQMRLGTNGLNTAVTIASDQDVTFAEGVEVSGKVSTSGGFELTVKDTVTVASASATAAASAAQNTRGGIITLDMGHTWANDSAFTVPVANTDIDADSMIVVCSSIAASFEAVLVVNDGCTLRGFNETGGGLTADFTITYMVL